MNDPDMDDLIGVIDIGKTHARFITASSAEALSECRLEIIPIVHPSAMRQLDLARIEAWLTEAIRTHPERDRIGTLVPIAHGAAGVLVDANDRVVIAPDYEDPCFD